MTLFPKRPPPEYQTDKFDSGLESEYRRLFLPVMWSPVSVIEIGVLYGGSMLWLDDYLDHEGTRITGVDNDLSRVKPEIAEKFSPRVKLFQGSQADDVLLTSLAIERGPFHAVIDDASHTADGTMQTWRALWPTVVPGGHYVIEDWGLDVFRGDRPETKGMAALVGGLIADARDLNVRHVRIVGDRRGSLAIFTKGDQPAVYEGP